jgi:type IV pilus assembly protein PilP
MTKTIRVFFIVFLVSAAALIVPRLKITAFSKAQAQNGSAKAALPSPTDMPLPAEFTNSAALPAPPSTPPTAKALVPAPPVQQRALPVELKSGITPPNAPSADEDLPPSALPSPQELDPSLKFLSSDGFVYDPTGRRDPFKAYIGTGKKDSAILLQQTNTAPRPSIPSLLQSNDMTSDSLENYDVNQLHVVAILWDVQDPKAMLAPSASKRMFMVHKRSKVGRNSGYVASIREGEVVVVELAPDGKTPSTRVMSLQH